MAKLRRRKGVNVWQARIKDENGTWISFSTGVPISLSGVPPEQLERKAQETADAQERLRRGSSTYKREVALLRAAAVARGEAEVIPTVADFLQNFPRGKRTTDSTEKTRRLAFRKFIAYLGRKSALPLDKISRDDCRGFLRDLLTKVKVGTATVTRDYLTHAFNYAIREKDFLRYNPMAGINLKDELADLGLEDTTTQREPFTTDELRVLLTRTPQPWQDLVATGYFLAGLRLSDCCKLRWDAIDWQDNRVTLTETKTKRKRILALSTALKVRLAARYAVRQEGEEYVFPSFARAYLSNNKSSAVSTGFTALLRALGILETLSEPQRGIGHATGRKSFHSIRHSVVSIARENPTLTADIVRETVGHQQERVEQRYYHASRQAQRSVVAALEAAVGVCSPPGEHDSGLR